MQKQVEAAQSALAMLLKELILLPTRIHDEEAIAMFSNIILDQVEKSYEELCKLTKEEN